MRVCAIVIALICGLNVQAIDLRDVWLNNYEAGVPATIDPDKYSSLHSLISEDLSKYKNLPAYTNMDVTLSYADIDAQSTAFAAFLQTNFNLKKGDRFAIMLPNILQYPVALFGILRAGGIVVSVNPLFTPDELQRQLADSGAVGIIVLENFAHNIAAIKAKTQIQHVIVTRISDVFNAPKSWMVDFNVKYIKRMVPAWSMPNSYWFKDVIAQGASLNYVDPGLTGEDVAFLQYTGGTTGIAKGAMLTHRNMVANILQSEAWMSKLLKPKQEIIITALPMYHIFSLTANCFTFMRYGSLNVLITNPRDMKSFVKQLKKFKFTAITGVNTLFNILLNQPEFAAVDFSALKFSGAGGMAVQKNVADKWQAMTGQPLLEAYGLTETSPAACMNPINLRAYNGTIGVPIPSTQISIRDDNKKELGIGAVGNLYIRGPQVMKGYWQQEAETRNVLSDDGWLDTGDIAIIEPNGFVRLIDRKKDMIIISGFKVYPNEVESVIIAIPGVAEVAVVGVKSRDSVETVKAVIVKKDPNLSEDAILEYCRQHLAGYKVPKIVEFRQNLPKSNINKILRYQLRENSKSHG